MLVLFIVESIGLGHAIRTYEVIKEYKKRGHEVRVIAHNMAAHFFKNEGIPTIDIPLSIALKKNKDKLDVGKTILEGIRIRNIAAFAAIGGVIRKEKPEAIIIDSNIIGVMATSATKNKTTPVVFISNDNTYQSGLKTTDKEKQNFGIIDNFVRASVDEYIVPDFPPPYTISEYNLFYNKKIKFIGPLSWAITAKLPKKTNGIFVTQGKSDVISEKIMALLKNKAVATEKEYKKKFATAEIIVHHGGHTTAMDCILLGKPQIIIPVDGYMERINNGKKIEELGFGKILYENWLDNKTLQYVIEEVKECKSKVKKFSRYACSYQAPKTIYEIIEGLLRF